MSSVAQAALAASLVVGMVSLPAVSQSEVEMPDAADRVPSEEITRTITPEGVRANVSTAFSDFVASIGPGSANASLTSSASRLEVSRSPERVERSFSTPEGDIRLVKTSESRVETVETPEGTLRTVKQGGEMREQFSGSDREKVEEAASELRDRMQQARERMDSKRKRIEPDTELDLVANESTAGGYGDNDREHVVIENAGEASVQLGEYTLQDGDMDSFELPERSLAPGESVKVFTNDRETVDGPSGAIYGSGLTWVNSGDTARLVKDGEKVVEESY